MFTRFRRTPRLVIVSNRLPVNVQVDGTDIRFGESTGGLVTGLRSYLKTLPIAAAEPSSYVWVGWPGGTVPKEAQESTTDRLRKTFNAAPVYLTDEEMEKFYLGFCNKTLWPLFHYFTSYAAYIPETWEQYRKINERFADAVAEVVSGGDFVWVHDYHLILLPALLRRRVPDAGVGFFLHIPFPSFEVFRLLPRAWRRELLEGMLGADLVGFHTYEYTQHFLQSVLRILEYDHHFGLITQPTHMTRVGTFPMGIDYPAFRNSGKDPLVIQEYQAFGKSLEGLKVVLSVDRLDYSKGILNRLQGFEILLERYPQYHGRVVLLIVVVPSRVAVDQYEQMKKQIEEAVGKINGRFGRIGWVPIVYQYRYVPFPPLAAMYGIGDIAMVTPLRDGMNLVAKEYVAARADRNGVLILSEMAGSAKELGEALIINPNYREEIAEALHDALEMSPDEQRRRMSIMQARLKRYDVRRWADDFISQLALMKREQEKYLAKLLPQDRRKQARKDYRRGTARLLLLDYDGTLVEFALRPQLARPGEALLGLLAALCADRHNTIVLVSGRDRNSLHQWFGALPLALVAEHGTWLKEANKPWEELRKAPDDWKERILPILQLYSDRLPGSFIEEKEHALVWHFRTADPEQRQIIVGELTDHMTAFTANVDIQVLLGSRVVEVRTAGANKGTAIRRWTSDDAHDFILAMGDDRTDEDMFKALPGRALSIKIGMGHSFARYNLRDPHEAVDFLKELAGYG